MHSGKQDNWLSLREDIPACTNGVYLNSAGASPTHSATHNAMVAHLQLERELGGYQAAIKAMPAIEAFYTNIGTLINAQPHEISYCENATRAWQMAFYALNLTKGDRVITHISEYSSNLIAMQHRAERDGIIIDMAPSLTDGTIDTAGLEQLITPRTKVIAITHIAMHLGMVNPAETIGAIANRHNLIFMLDACQSLGQRVINVENIGCHILTATGRKFLRGPRGTGLLYVNASILPTLQPAFIDNLSATWQEDGSFCLSQSNTRFESWERNISGMLGLAKAVEILNQIGPHCVQARVSELASYAVTSFSSSRFTTFESACESTDKTSRETASDKLSGIITLKLEHTVNPFDIAQQLEQQGVRLSVIKRQQAFPYFRFRHVEQEGIIRIGLHYFNTHADIDFLNTQLQAIVPST